MTRVLIVDDDSEICEELADLLEAEGMQVETCHDGHDARARLARNAYDLVLLDLKLPGVSGLEVLRWYAAQPGRGRVIVVSGTPQAGPLKRLANPDEPDDQAEAASLADAFLAKPFAVEDLLAVCAPDPSSRA